MDRRWQRQTQALREGLSDYLRGLTDLEFTQWLTPRLLPTLYRLAILASAYAVGAYALAGFAQSWGTGLTRLLLVGPVAFLVLVTLSRIALELCLAVFRIASQVTEMASHTGDLADTVPRITFWKTPKRKPEGPPR
ncbi:MAG TPA: DUF4282 domain-containing protein [Nevskiaceae bacterium]|nr:DUF4282 domain-containing protein [Nevskiaceae bacterium]